MRLVAHIPDDLHKELQEYIDRRYHGRHGAVSITIEDAIREFLDKHQPGKA